MPVVERHIVTDLIRIVDNQTPIMIMVGPSNCGKSMVAHRMFAWLVKRGYSVDVDRKLYVNGNHQNTEIFDLVSQTPSLSTQHLVLYKITKNGNPVLQVLDSPGREWFDYNNDSFGRVLSVQVYQMINCSNKKIWIYFTEPEWEQSAERKSYVKTIQHIKMISSKRDRHIVMLNKVDRDASLNPQGHVLMVKGMGIERFLDLQYPGLLKLFSNNCFFSKWYRKYCCNILPFMTGDYQQKADGRIVYSLGPDVYPETMWIYIMK